MKQIDKDRIKRILIRSANWVGDAIMTTPALWSIRQHFQDAEISILAKPWVAPVFYKNPHVDRILSYDAAGRHGGWLGIPRLCRDLRKFRFDLAILFQNAFEAALLAAGAGVPNRVGYTTDGRSLLLTHRVHRGRSYKQQHQIDYYQEILKGIGLICDNRKPTLVLDEKERQSAAEILHRHHILETDSVLGINPGAAYGTAKRWPQERYAGLCDKLRKAHETKIVIFGGPGEEALGERIAGTIAGGCVNLCGKTSLREAMALIERCRLFITNDSGLMHVAAALDRPLIAIFGSTDHITTGPYGSNSRIVRTSMPCSPCLKPECPEDHQCMKQISIDMVYVAAQEFLGDAGH
ncbi:lipopolysaccharide heptosyltransferase II [Thermodesulfobacteriota bacterium]